MASKSTMNKQIRSFAFVWTFITFLVGMMVFFAIYLTYDIESSPALAASSSDIILPEREAVAVVSNAQVFNAPDAAQASPIATISLSDFASQPPAASATPLPINTDDQFIVSIQVQRAISGSPDVQRAWMNDVRDMNLTWFKQQIRWSEIEPERGVYDWSSLDLTLPIAQEYGFNVIGSVVSAPDWAREQGADLNFEGPPANYQDFANFLTALVQRYPGQIHALELWNEPNIDREWMSNQGVSAANFVNLVRVGSQAIKNVDPGIIVISGAPSPTGGFVDGAGVLRAINDFDYVDQMIAAGVLNYIDCFGVHHNGYNLSPLYRWNEVPPNPNALFRGPFDNPHHSWSFRSTLETYYNKIAVAGRPDMKLCITEFGWASVEELDGYPQNFEFAVDNSLADQRDYTIQALDLMEEWGYVWIAVIWNLNYAPQAGWSTESDNVPYSLISPDYSKRPAYEAVRDWVAARSGN
jgi:hypothetical protein